MPQTVTKTYTLYQFNELSDEAKEKARDWYRQTSEYDNNQFAFESIVDDANNIGLRITELQTCRSSTNQGDFIGTAKECADKIIEEHGLLCETYKTASAFIQDLKELEKEYEAKGKLGEDQHEEAKEYLYNEFIFDLLMDYRAMYQKEIDYQQSDEVIDENMEANEYTFTEDGKRCD